MNNRAKMTINSLFIQPTTNVSSEELTLANSTLQVTNRYLIISDELESILITINIVVLVGAISMFGIASNVMNLLVFFKQGFVDSINLSFTALAVSDLCCLVTSFWLSVLWNPLFLNSQLPMLVTEIQVPLASWPHGCFCRITGWITAFITFERCLCVALPLKIKRIVTTRVTMVALVSVYFFMFLTMLPLYLSTYIGWKFSVKSNKTLLGIFVTAYQGLAVGISVTLHIVIQLTCFFAVLISNVILVVSLKKTMRWRNNSDSTGQISTKNAAKQYKTIKMVTVISLTYVVSYLPTIIFLTMGIIQTDFNDGGPSRNVFFVTWSFVTLCDVLNSAVNIFVYYRMSSKFKKSCDEMFTTFFTRICKTDEMVGRNVNEGDGTTILTYETLPDAV